MVAEGRDIGTVVAPAAPLKVFLTASTDARAQRRSRQDGTTDHSSTAAELDRRDTYDSARKHSPLRPADDAVHVDTTALGVTEVIQRLVDLATERGIVQGSAAAVPRRRRRTRKRRWTRSPVSRPRKQAAVHLAGQGGRRPASTERWRPGGGGRAPAASLQGPRPRPALR